MKSTLSGGTTRIAITRSGEGISTKSPKRWIMEHQAGGEDPQRAAIVERKLAQLRGGR